MRYLALATDYDGTLAHRGVVDAAVLTALERLRASGRKLILISGRELGDLATLFDRFDLFDQVVLENGAVVYSSATGEQRLLAKPPAAGFVAELQRRGVQPLAAGRVIVATREPHARTVTEVIHHLGLELQVILNKDAVMVLPFGVDKASGLRAALHSLAISAESTVGVGDAENDLAFLKLCGAAAAVSNALPAVKEQCDLVTAASHGQGVAELIEMLLADDLAGIEPRCIRAK